MLLFIATHGHAYLAPLADGTFGAELPPCRFSTYDALFRSSHTIRATHVFTDIERLYPWELSLAADLYRELRKAGVPCLNDPARVMCRYELLRNLHLAGINPYTVYRADDRPRPARFPVFIRSEAEHSHPLSGLLPDQAALDRTLTELQAGGTSWRGLIVVEYAAEPIAPGLWRRFGTYQVGDGTSVDHCVIEDKWLVKYGVRGLATPEMLAYENSVVISNSLADSVRPALQIAGVEWGRCDHATFGGREIVYEINTNPSIGPLIKQRLPIRDETLLHARKRMAGHIWNIDFGDGSEMAFGMTNRLEEFRARNKQAGPSLIRT